MPEPRAAIMDGRPPDYSSHPNYNNYNEDDFDQPSSGSAVRLLTSMDEPASTSRPYVLPPLNLPSPRHLMAPPLALRSKQEPRSKVSSEPPLPDQPKTPTTPRAVPSESSVTLSDVPAQQSSPPTTRRPTVKLQKRKRRPKMQSRGEDEAGIVQSLPVIPDGPSPRKSILLNKPPSGGSSSTQHVKFQIPGDESSLQTPNSIRPIPRRSYPPAVESDRSSLLNAPHMPPPEASYYQRRDMPEGSYYQTGDVSDGGSYYHVRDNPSPTRPWSPSLMSVESGYGRPPPSSMNYEPSDLNGSPRPGTPSSRYGGSPRRPLPRAPAPLFTRGARESVYTPDDATVNIPLDPDHDDPFAHETDMGETYYGQDSYGMRSQVTLNTMDDEEAETPFDDKPELYGPAPDGKQERRGVRAPQVVKKEVQLINGELVLECKIPTILYSFLPRRDEVEFTHMRYTAVTCDPDDFVERGYKLRQNIGKTIRETELFICVTMYNEDEIGFTRTMHAVMKNISHFCGRNKSRTWGENGWQKIVVCIVSDGREKIHLRTLDALAAMGVYQHGIAKNFVNQKAVQAHVYEYTTQVSLDSDLKFKGAEKGIVPCQMIFCLKEKNQKKINSHRWFFNAFGKALNPNVCILLDVGTKPGKNSLYHLWKAFDTDSTVAGACGEIKAMKGKWASSLLNPLVASQNFEYKMSNILDKPLESVFGYITVLPGALSAYRYHALQNDETGHGPLSQYFKGETLHGQHADVFTANMYLAEDRILCWELVAKRSERWVLKYVKGCTGETDVPGKWGGHPRADGLDADCHLRYCLRVHLAAPSLA